MMGNHDEGNNNGGQIWMDHESLTMMKENNHEYYGVDHAFFSIRMDLMNGS